MANKLLKTDEPLQEVELLSAKLDRLMAKYNKGLDDDIEFRQLKAIHVKIKELKILIDKLSMRA